MYSHTNSGGKRAGGYLFAAGITFALLIWRVNTTLSKRSVKV